MKEIEDRTCGVMMIDLKDHTSVCILVGLKSFYNGTYWLCNKTAY
jgi:hypothetical protein